MRLKRIALIPKMQIKLHRKYCNFKLKKKLYLNNYLKVRKVFLITSKNNFDKVYIYKKLGYKILFINNTSSSEFLKKILLFFIFKFVSLKFVFNNSIKKL